MAAAAAGNSNNTTNDSNSYHPITDAAWRGDLGKVMALVQEDPGCVDIVNAIGSTPLYVASCFGKLDMVNYLLDHGANIHKTVSNGYNPLSIACSWNRLVVVELLVGKGADVTFRVPCHRQTLLMVACENKAIDVLKYLLTIDEVKSTLDEQDHHGKTALHYAGMSGVPEIMQVSRHISTTTITTTTTI